MVYDEEMFKAAIELIVKNITNVTMCFNHNLQIIVYDLNTEMKSGCKVYLENDTIHFIKRYGEETHTFKLYDTAETIFRRIVNVVAQCYEGRSYANKDWEEYFTKNDIRTNKGNL
ncbi:MAG: hypothetical protein NC222_07020 [Staphylococcus sp.]|nr:hypothetical protein [Staphylococcus sp.]